MSKKVVLVAGVLLAVGAAAAMSAPSLRGQRHGSLLDDLADGVGRATQHISQAIGVFDEAAAPTREGRRGRRAKQRRGDDERADEVQSAESDNGSEPPREARGTGWRGRERQIRQAEDDGDASADARRPAERDRAELDDAGREARRPAAFAQDRYGQSFGRFDRNGDGSIEMSEFLIAETERIAARAQTFFKRFDKDGDGKVTREEFGRSARERFTALDTDDAGDAAQGARSGRAAVK
ncbi:MAG TPA: EF-hand domain-containing protein [Hyphomicrobiaceae bacterium]|nr:EF-hand domain-containing protein [Hyphomicrobiaceae bacterium]